MRKRVIVAMSGGVDSSVAAALLREQGHDVIGVTMCFSAEDGSTSGGNFADFSRKKPICCSRQGIEDAQRVAHKLEIRHYVLNMHRALQEYVIKDFCREYINGRTPNPCIRCNQFIKFNILLKKTESWDAQFLATGHYARIIKTKKGYQLKKAKDLNKDQSYFLYRLSQNQLSRILFPLGNYKKEQVRLLARKFQLPVADKLASQEICFLPGPDYRGFLKSQMQENIMPGLIVDRHGNVLGRHKGIAFYTIGQRQGLGIAKGYPLYITKIDPKNNRITVGMKQEALKTEFLIRDIHFILRPVKKRVAVEIRIRYNHKEARGKIMLIKNKIRAKFIKPQFAITPGQSAVFYDKDILLGGGIIDEALN